MKQAYLRELGVPRYIEVSIFCIKLPLFEGKKKNAVKSTAYCQCWIIRTPMLGQSCGDQELSVFFLQPIFQRSADVMDIPDLAPLRRIGCHKVHDFPWFFPLKNPYCWRTKKDGPIWEDPLINNMRFGHFSVVLSELWGLIPEARLFSFLPKTFGKPT